MLLALTLALLAGCHQREHELFERAAHAREADDFELAARLYREVTILAPASPLAADALLELAKIHYLHLRDVDAASDRLRKILSDHQGTRAVPEARKLLARIYEEDLGDLDKALEQYHALLELERERGTEELLAPKSAPTDPEASLSEKAIHRKRQTLLSIASCLYRLNELQEARRVYGEVIALPYHPDADDAYLRLANLERLAGNDEEAIVIVRELTRRTERPDRRHEAAVAELSILIETGRFNGARSRLDEARASFGESDSLASLSARLEEAARSRRALDAEHQAATLEQEQKRIRWGGGRRARRAQP